MDTYERLIKQPNNNRYQHKYISPSSMIADPSDCRVEIVADFESRIPLEDSGSNITAIGTCLHNIFCVYSPGRLDNTRVAQNIINATGLSAVIVDIDSVLRAIHNLYAYLTAQYGKSIAIHLEHPFINARGGQIVRGNIDMVWETEQGCIIVDYKSFPGKRDNISNPSDKHYAGNHLAQLAEYKEAVAAAGKNIIDTLVFYSVQGRVVRIIL